MYMHLLIGGYQETREDLGHHGRRNLTSHGHQEELIEMQISHSDRKLSTYAFDVKFNSL